MQRTGRDAQDVETYAKEGQRGLLDASRPIQHLDSVCSARRCGAREGFGTCLQREPNLGPS